jgi:hypothetical protein
MRSPTNVAVLTFILILVTANYAAAVAQSCYRPTGFFASEVLLNKPGVTYDLSQLEATGNVSVIRSSVLYRSHYEDRVGVILTPMELFQEKGLDLRLQLPTRTITETTQSLIIERNVTVKVLDLEPMGGQGTGWILNLDYRPDPLGGPPIQVANLTKGNLQVSIIPNANETFPDTYVGIEATNMTVLNDQNRTEFSTIFDLIGFPQTFDTFIKDQEFKILTRTFKNLDNDLETTWGETEWGDAMKTELQWLISNRVISGLSNDDVETLSTLSPYAWGEHNYKSRWYTDGWTLGVTEEMINANYTYEYQGLPNCDGFDSSVLPSSSVQDFNTGFQPQEIVLGQDFTGAGIRAAIVGAAIIAVSILYIRRRNRIRSERG